MFKTRYDDQNAKKRQEGYINYLKIRIAGSSSIGPLTYSFHLRPDFIKCHIRHFCFRAVANIIPHISYSFNVILKGQVRRARHRIPSSGWFVNWTVVSMG